MSGQVRLLNRTIQLGTWLSSGSPVIAELAGGSGFDWVLIDLEHGSGTEADVLGQLRALNGTSTLAIVRVGAPSADLIARVLDWGAHGIMVPHVNSAAEARACVQAMRYPPRGKRGVSRSVRAYRYGREPFTGSDPQCDPVFLAQIETTEAVTQAADIAAVDGVTALFIGPADLQFDLQAQSQIATQAESTSTIPTFDQALESVQTAAQQHGKEYGILVRDAAALNRYRDAGYTWLAVESDLGILRAGYDRLVSAVKGTP